MAEPDLKVKTGQTYPPLAAVLTDALGAAIPLINASGVRFVMRPATGGVAIDRAAVIVSAAAGSVRYDWQAGDTATAGDYVAEFWITWSAGGEQPVPSDDVIRVRVKVGLG